MALAERGGTSDGTPPDDYRHIPILPTPADLRSKKPPFLRPNITKGSYSSNYHYLDVQFRLLREDFVGPLRDGIQTHLANLANPLPRNQRKRNIDVHIYYDVTIKRPVFTHREEGVLYRVEFSLCNLKRIKWHNTKRLVYGSLVCLSHDNFKTLLFGTVTEREVRLLRLGMVDIKLLNIRNMDPARVYTMVESTAFYESYRPVLQVLQKFNECSIPMQTYIIQASHDIKKPKYLRGRHEVQYDIQSLMENCKTKLEEKTEFMIDILDENAWPDTDKLVLDASQVSAVKSALTKELAVIQGPPGTGKTYIGLKIVEALLKNKESWNVAPNKIRKNDSNTIMVISYTNHALDQFLEGILEFCPKKLVRIGGRSKSEKLKEFNLRRLIRNYRFRKGNDHETHDVSKRMIEAEEMLKLCEKYIINEYALNDIIDYEHFRCLSNYREEYGIHWNCSSLPTWLGLLSTPDDLNRDYLDDEYEGNLDGDVQGEEHEPNTKNVITELDMLLNQREDYDVYSKQNFETRKKEIVIGLYYSAVAYDQTIKTQNSSQEKFRTTVLKNLNVNNDAMTEEEVNRCLDICRLSTKDRWRLYRYWIIKYKHNLRQILFEQQKRYDGLVGRRIRGQVHRAKCEVLRDAYVIGMTTTGAAKNESLLNEVRPRIVVVEEAAEILEAHIVTSLTQQCEHLILIGDHQQLKPNPTVYKLATKYNLDTSLFERMLKNGIPCQKLSSQHRMRPEIADIMRNHFYNHLLDDECVKHYDDVGGVNQFFINHNIQEQSDEYILSKSNIHEAQYCLALARYLVQQGYDASEITILTTYTGQVLEIRRMLRSNTYDSLRAIYVSSVDSYQGEENEIVLLSLVRSNEVGSIGFLKISNRMCVALSRAKIGFFCIGNFKLLSENNELWMKIVNDMRSRNLVGKYLELYCQKHPKTKVKASVARDFDRCPLGGCTLKCETLLGCGHMCSMLCHPRDSNHEEYKCKEKCTRECIRGHNCQLQCFRECYPCKIAVNKILDCQHEIQIECEMFDELLDCRKPCEKLLQCGHKCRNKCFEKCTTKCKEVVTKTFMPCGHNIQLQCCVNSCQAPCEKSLACGHSCKRQCGDLKCSNVCYDRCTRLLSCGHRCKEICCEPCTDRCVKVIKEIALPCGHTETQLCCQSDQPLTCKQQCSRTLACGHLCTRKCVEKCSVESCRYRCQFTFACGHQCERNCKDCLNGQFHGECKERCMKKLICGHSCQQLCSLIPCQPCKEPCQFRCWHRMCRRTCSQYCEPCKWPCEWQCYHFQCSKACDEFCDRGRCKYPCSITCPSCQQKCVALCGEPCVCLLCDRYFFSSTVRSEYCQKYVYLYECCHAVEVSKMDQYMDKDEGIRRKECPLCQTTIRYNPRYGNVLKTIELRIDAVKRKALAERSFKQVEKKRKDMLSRISVLKTVDKRSILEEITACNGIQYVRLLNIDMIITVLERVEKIREHLPINETSRDIPNKLTKLEQNVLDSNNILSEQMLDDFSSELTRLNICAQLEKLRSETIPEASHNISLVLSTILHSKVCVTENMFFSEALKLLRQERQKSNDSLVHAAKKSLEKCLSFGQEDWSACFFNHVFNTKSNGHYRDIKKCQECENSRRYTEHQHKKDTRKRRRRQIEWNSKRMKMN